jgi:hypothetical protein
MYALGAAGLLALQEPFSALAARGLPAPVFVGVTQSALLAAIPLLVARREAWRDFVALLKRPSNWFKLFVLLGVGLGGLVLYDIGLSSAHPIITAAVLNLSPFWAAMVARIISRKVLAVSSVLFFGCFSTAFIGAMVIAWSQIEIASATLLRDVMESAIHSRWVFALPMPIFFALSGTLVYDWFSRYTESAAIAANFLVSATVLIPVTFVITQRDSASSLNEASTVPILLLLIGTLASSAAGRLFYQEALTATKNDNGFVTMFFLVIPALSALVSWPLSRWIRVLRFDPSPLFFAGMGLVIAPLFVFSVLSWRVKEAPAG